MNATRPQGIHRSPLGAALALALLAVTTLLGGCATATADEPISEAAQAQAEPDTQEPTADGALRNAYALTTSGELVELRPSDGTVIRSVATDPLWTGSTLTISADGAYAYVHAYDSEDDAGPEWPGSIQRIALSPSEPEGTADVETVATTATSPAVSPDGRFLAYYSVAPWKEPLSQRSLTVMDLTTGEVTASIPDPECVECERLVTPPTWTPDSARIVVGLGWFDEFPAAALWEVDPATTPTLGDARRVGPDNTGDVQADWFGTTSFTAAGTLAVPAEEGTADQWAAAAAYAFGDGPKENLPAGLVALVDVTDGSVVGRIPLDGIAISLAAEPGGNQLLVVVSHPDTEIPQLYRWDGSALVQLADGFAAIGW